MIGTGCDRCARFLKRMRTCTDTQGRSGNAARILERKIIRSEMDTIGSDGQRDVEPIIHDRCNAVRRAHLAHRACVRHQITIIKRLLSHLHTVNSAANRLRKHEFPRMPTHCAREKQTEPPLHGARRARSVGSRSGLAHSDSVARGGYPLDLWRIR